MEERERESDKGGEQRVDNWQCNNWALLQSMLYFFAICVCVCMRVCVRPCVRVCVCVCKLNKSALTLTKLKQRAM